MTDLYTRVERILNGDSKSVDERNKHMEKLMLKIDRNSKDNKKSQDVKYN